MSEHPWSIIPVLVKDGILTHEQAASLILNTNAYSRLMLELQSLLTEVNSKGEDQIAVHKLVMVVNKVQMMEVPSY
jgi:hypothetical protein